VLELRQYGNNFPGMLIMPDLWDVSVQISTSFCGPLHSEGPGTDKERFMRYPA